MRAQGKTEMRRAGGLVMAFAALLGLIGLFTGSAGAQTSGGATATDGSVASGGATASGGSTASGCSTAINNSTASGGECLLQAPTTAAPPTTATTVPPTTPTTDGGTTPTTKGVVPTTAPPRLAVTGSGANRLAQWALGALFGGLVLVALGLEAPARTQRYAGSRSK